MRQQILLDTGPLVAVIDRRDQFHRWAKEEWGTLEIPLLTCEAVMTEACFLLQNVFGGEDAAIAMMSRGVIQIPLHLDEETDRLRELLARYRSVPMSLADACLVRMAEQWSGSTVLTLDSDFTIYRKNNNQVIPVIMPDRTP